MSDMTSQEESVKQVVKIITLVSMLLVGYAGRIGAIVIAYRYFGWPLVATLVIGHVSVCLTKSCWEGIEKL